MAEIVPTALWLVRPDVVLALDEHLGTPTDSYVNGSQTWLEPNGPGGMVLEWRLHPVGGYERPGNLGTYEVWERAVDALRSGDSPDSLTMGDHERALSTLWEGLECFPAFGDTVEPGVLTSAAAEALGLPPDRAGLVDHESVGDRWERERGQVSIVSLLVEQLDRPPGIA